MENKKGVVINFYNKIITYEGNYTWVSKDFSTIIYRDKSWKVAEYTNKDIKSIVSIEEHSLLKERIEGPFTTFFW